MELRNGYSLIDSFKRNQKSPNTWHLISKQKVDSIKVGWLVKVGVEFVENNENYPGERFWCVVQEIQNNHTIFVVKVYQADMLFDAEHGISNGDIITVGRNNIIDSMPKEDM